MSASYTVPQSGTAGPITTFSDSADFSQQSENQYYLAAIGNQQLDDKYYFQLGDGRSFYITDIQPQGLIPSNSAFNVSGIPPAPAPGYGATINASPGEGYVTTFDLHDGYNGKKLLDNFGIAFYIRIQDAYYNDGVRFDYLDGVLSVSAPYLTNSGLGKIFNIFSNGEFDFADSPPTGFAVLASLFLNPIEPAAGFSGVQIQGSSTPNTIVGSPGSDTLNGLDGDDSLTGFAGNDKLIGGSGNDKLIGGSGNDRLVGGTGRNIFKGGRGKNVMLAGSDHDTFILGEGRDIVRGFDIKEDQVFIAPVTSFEAYLAPRGYIVLSMSTGASAALYGSWSNVDLSAFELGNVTSLNPLAA